MQPAIAPLGPRPQNDTVAGLYPAAPAQVPAELTAPTTEYKLHVAVMVVSIIAFLSVYGAMLAGLGWVLFHTWEVIRNGDPHAEPFWWVVASVLSSMLLVFMLKGLFKRNKMDKDSLLEIDEHDEPRLFAFLRTLSAETGAPFPKRVYLSRDVNAAVFYDSSLLSLLLPVRKNMVIGLGLVNALNLSELKAVLGHELGHFSQKSMRLGRWVYVANQVLGDMIWGRDAWDRFIDKGTRVDIRIAVFFWVLKGIVWLMRKLLGLLFKAINFVHLALQREMELAADRVAVSVAGSDAIVHALLKAEFADACMDLTARELLHAADHGWYTDDLYFHQERSPEYLRRVSQKPDWGLPPPLPADPWQWAIVFEKEEFSAPHMWASHPSSHDRELGAKEVYLRSHIDERSAWLLFRDAAALRKRMTRHAVARVHGEVALKPAEEIQAFVDGERAETTFDPRYHGMYEDRFISPGDPDEAFAHASAEPRAAGDLAALYQELWGPDLATFMGKLKERQKEAERLGMFLAGAGGKSLAFRGEELRKGDAQEALESVGGDIEGIEGELEQLDRRVLEIHLQLALGVAGGGELELLQRYRFQVACQAMFQRTTMIGQMVTPHLEVLGEGRQLSEDEVNRLYQALKEAHGILSAILAQAGKLELPDLAHIEQGDFYLLKDALIDDTPLYTQALDGEWIGGFLGQIGEVRDKLRRLHFKSLGRLVTLQERIALEWHQKMGFDGSVVPKSSVAE